MAMSELKQKLLLYELAKIGFRDAQYHPVSDRIHVQPDNERMPKISNDGSIKYGTEYGNLAVNTLRPLVDRVNEAAAAWDKSGKMPFEDLKQYRVLAEYNGIMMAARDDTVYGRGLHFATWQYNYDRTGLDHGHYTEDYNACKEDFAVRSGLIPEVKLFTQEQAAEIKTSIEYRLNNDDDITISTENDLNSIAARLRAAYPEKDAEIKQGKEIESRIDSLESPVLPTTVAKDAIQIGDLVFSTPQSKYGYECLVGKVIDIVPHDSSDQNAAIHVDFFAPYSVLYSENRINEIVERFSAISDMPSAYEELPLSDVVVPPENLVRLNGKTDTWSLQAILSSYENAESFYQSHLSEQRNELHAELVGRINKNYADYTNSLSGFGQNEVIDMAAKITAMSEAHDFITMEHHFDTEELEILLQFQNPLEVVADRICDRRSDFDDIYAAIEYAKEYTGLLLENYPLIKDEYAAESVKSQTVQEAVYVSTTKTIFGEVQSGDWVIAAGNNDYGYLIGTVTAIDKLGTPEHNSGNETDDIHVDFTAFDYPPERIAEIEKDFSELFDEEKDFGELPLDDVIMAPSELIRITHLGHDEITRMGNLRQNCESFCNCFISPSLHHGAKFDELVKRVDKNLADYHKILDGFGQGELIDMAGRIDAMNEAHHYLTLCYAFSAEELDFYLQFENPLEIVADGLTERRNYSDDLDFCMEHLNEHRDMILTDYPIINRADTIVADKSQEMEKPPEKSDISEYEDNGQRIIPATNLPDGWEWRMYDDGSGGLYSPDNKSIVEVDFATSEYRHDGKWHFIAGYPYETVSSGEFMESMEKLIHSSLEYEPVKPKTLAEKMKAATEKVKAQETHSSDKKSHKREERD